MACNLPHNHGSRSDSVGGANPGTLLRSCLALLACLEGAAGPPRPTAALPQISRVEPITTPFPRVGAGLPWAEQPCTTLCGDSAWQESAAAASGPSLRKRSQPLSSVRILSSSKGPWRVPRRSNSRLSRREPSLLVLWKKGSSSAMARISFCVSNHSSSSLSAGVSAKDRKPRVSRADWVGRQKFNSLDGSE